MEIIFIINFTINNISWMLYFSQLKIEVLLLKGKTGLKFVLLFLNMPIHQICDPSYWLIPRYATRDSKIYKLIIINKWSYSSLLSLGITKIHISFYIKIRFITNQWSIHPYSVLLYDFRYSQFVIFVILR